MIYYIFLILLILSVVILLNVEKLNQRGVATCLTIALISGLALSINNGKGWETIGKGFDTVAPTNKVVSKVISAENLSVKDDNFTITYESGYKILIQKNTNKNKYTYEVYKDNEKLEGVRFYGFSELFHSFDKIRNKSYKTQTTFDFQERDGKLVGVYFKLTPNDFDIDY